MSQPALSSKSLPLSPASSAERDANLAIASASALSSPLLAKTFAQLSSAEKDTLLEIIALKLGLVKPS